MPDPGGGVSSLAFGNGLTETATYDPRYRLAQLTSGPLSVGYGYDPANNVTSIVDGRGSAFNSTFEYDLLDRLKIVHGFGATEFTYDPLGNRQTAGQVTYHYNGQLRLTSTTGSVGLPYIGAFGYDAAGNVTADPSGTYTFNGRSLMATASVGGPDHAMRPALLAAQRPQHGGERKQDEEHAVGVVEGLREDRVAVEKDNGRREAQGRERGDAALDVRELDANQVVRERACGAGHERTPREMGPQSVVEELQDRRLDEKRAGRVRHDVVAIRQQADRDAIGNLEHVREIPQNRDLGAMPHHDGCGDSEERRVDHPGSLAPNAYRHALRNVRSHVVA